MQQQQRRFLEILDESRRLLLLAQQEFEEKMQIFIAQRNATREPQPLHLSVQSWPHRTLPLTAIRSQPDKNMINQPVDASSIDTSGYPSPLNSQFLSPSGDYNHAATGVPWFQSSLFSLLPFMRKNTSTSSLETRTTSSADFIRAMQYVTNNTQTVPNIAQYVPVPTAQDRPQSLLSADSNPSYSTMPSHDPPQYQTERTIRTLPRSHTDGGTIYRPPWPPPYDSSGRPAFSRSANSKSGQRWHTNHDQSGHLCLIIRPTRHVSQASYFLNHRRPPTPPQYRILSLHCVSLPTSLTEDKNLLRPP